MSQQIIVEVPDGVSPNPQTLALIALSSGCLAPFVDGSECFYCGKQPAKWNYQSRIGYTNKLRGFLVLYHCDDCDPRVLGLPSAHGPIGLPGGPTRTMAWEGRKG